MATKAAELHAKKNTRKVINSMANQKQAQQTLKSGGRIHNGLQCNASGGLRTDVKGRLNKKQVNALIAKNPGARITETR